MARRSSELPKVLFALLGTDTMNDVASMAVSYSIKCHACGRRSQIGSLVDHWTCWECGERLSILFLWHSKVLSPPVRTRIYRILSRAKPVDDDDELSLAASDPTCACGQILGGMDAITEAAGRGSITCASCGRSSSIRIADRALQELTLLDELRFVVGEVDAPGAKNNESTTAKCSNCGALLPPAGAGDIVTCDYCHAVERLSEIGRRRNPSSKHVLYFCLKPDQKLLSDEYVRVCSDEQALQAAQDPATAPSTLEGLAKRSTSDGLKSLLVANPATPDTGLVELVNSGDRDLKQRILDRFKRDGGSDVLKAALAPFEEVLGQEEAAKQRARDEALAKERSARNAKRAGLALVVGVVVALVAYLGIRFVSASPNDGRAAINDTSHHSSATGR